MRFAARLLCFVSSLPAAQVNGPMHCALPNHDERAVMKYILRNVFNFFVAAATTAPHTVAPEWESPWHHPTMLVTRNGPVMKIHTVYTPVIRVIPVKRMGKAKTFIMSRE
jgi:hypothetical protein